MLEKIVIGTLLVILAFGMVSEIKTVNGLQKEVYELRLQLKCYDAMAPRK